MKKGFTLIEILVVVTIIGLLAVAGTVSYSTLTKGSRDAKRRSDLANIQTALEQYRSQQGYYPVSVTISCPPSGSITDGTNTYMSLVPNDPKCGGNEFIYYYVPKTSSGDPCGGADCATYLLGAHLENSSQSTSCGTNCGSGGAVCSYCLGPYGQL